MLQTSRARILTSGSMSSAKGAEEFWKETNGERQFSKTKDPQVTHRCSAQSWPCMTTSAEPQRGHKLEGSGGTSVPAEDTPSCSKHNE